MLGLLPWDKLHPLILGPLMIAVGIFVFLVPNSKPSTHTTSDIVWGVNL